MYAMDETRGKDLDTIGIDGRKDNNQEANNV